MNCTAAANVLSHSIFQYTPHTHFRSHLDLGSVAAIREKSGCVITSLPVFSFSRSENRETVVFNLKVPLFSANIPGLSQRLQTQLSVTASSLNHILPLSLTFSLCVHPFQAASFFCRHKDTSYPPCQNKNLWPTLSRCAPKQWNSLLSDIRHIQSSYAFITALKTHLYRQYHVPDATNNFTFCILPFDTPFPSPNSSPSLIPVYTFRL